MHDGSAATYTYKKKKCLNVLAMKRDFDDFILASPIIQNVWRQTFFSSF